METRLFDYHAHLALRATEPKGEREKIGPMAALVQLSDLPDAEVVRRHVVRVEKERHPREHYLAEARIRAARYRAKHPQRFTKGQGLRVTQIAECCGKKYRRWRYADGEFAITGQTCFVCEQPLRWRSREHPVSPQ